MGDFRDVQAVFTAHVRDPARSAPPGDVAPARMALYAALVHRNLDSLLASCFPVLRAVVPEAAWERAVRAFLARHRARTPLFTRLSGEFVRFLQEDPIAADLPGFARELAHYEALELEVGYDTRELDDIHVDADADPFEDVPVLNPLARPHAYRYPVQRFSPDYVPDSPPEHPTYLVIYRDDEDRVAFVELTAVTARLVELMLYNPARRRGAELVQQIARELAHPAPARLAAFGRDIMNELWERQLVIGARIPEIEKSGTDPCFA